MYGIFHIFHKQQFNYTKDRVSDCPVLLTALWTSCMYVDTAVRAYKRVLEAVKCLPIVYSWYCDFSVFFFIFHKNFIIFIKNSLKLTLQKWRGFFYLFVLLEHLSEPSLEYSSCYWTWTIHRALFLLSRTFLLLYCYPFTEKSTLHLAGS